MKIIKFLLLAILANLNLQAVGYKLYIRNIINNTQFKLRLLNTITLDHIELEPGQTVKNFNHSVEIDRRIDAFEDIKNTIARESQFIIYACDEKTYQSRHFLHIQRLKKKFNNNPGFSLVIGNVAQFENCSFFLDKPYSAAYLMVWGNGSDAIKASAILSFTEANIFFSSKKLDLDKDVQVVSAFDLFIDLKSAIKIDDKLELSFSMSCQKSL